nr:hypothetical protein [Tanacetum cinerariifolium]
AGAIAARGGAGGGAQSAATPCATGGAGAAPHALGRGGPPAAACNGSFRGAGRAGVGAGAGPAWLGGCAAPSGKDATAAARPYSSKASKSVFEPPPRITITTSNCPRRGRIASSAARMLAGASSPCISAGNNVRAKSYGAS